MRFYSDVFGEAAPPDIHYYGKDADGVNGIEGNVMFAAFNLAGNNFMAADSAYPHGFTFSEGISFSAYCQSQEEIDAFWERLTVGGEEQPCGWLKDRFGLSWQIVPHNIEELGDASDPVRAGRVNAALMNMSRIDMGALQAAYNDMTV